MSGRTRPCSATSSAGRRRGGDLDSLADAVRRSYVSHAALAELHPTEPHVEVRERLLVLLDAFEVVEGSPASREQVERVHTPAYLDRLEAIEVPTLLDPDTVASETSYEAALLAAGCTIGAVDRGGFALVRPPGHHAPRRPRDGLLPLQQRRGRGALRAGRAGHRTRRDRRLGRAPRQRHAGHLLGRRRRCSSCRCTSGRSTRAPAGPARSNETTVNVPLPAGSGDAEYLRAFDRARRAGRARGSSPSSCSCRRASTRTWTIRSPGCA